MACNQCGGFMKLKKNKYIEKLGVKRKNHSANFLKGLDYKKSIKNMKKNGELIPQKHLI